MKRLTLKSTVAAIAITSAATAWAQTDMNADANADVSADTETSTTVDNALDNTGEVLSNTAEEVGEAMDDTSAAIAEGAEDAYDSATDTETASDDAAVTAPETTAQTDADVADTDASETADAQSDAGAEQNETEMTADAQTDEAAPDAEMVDGFSGMTVADVVGQSVIEANGNDVGDVDSVIRDGDEIAVVIGMGGFLGFGQHDVAVPLDRLTQGADGTLQLSDTTQEELNLMPEVDMDSVTELSADQPI
ncbi:PRC-barrel domain-containing protein [Sulfitobacter alexandrii]|nr:PRC-barrel domain-containing protein [Sulfitobacter alexandrii]